METYRRKRGAATGAVGGAPARAAAPQPPDVQPVDRLHARGAAPARPRRAAARRGQHHGAAGPAGLRQHRPQEGSPRALHRPGRPPGPQRAPLLPGARGSPRGVPAHRLHAHRGPGLPAVQPHLPPGARPLDHPRAPGPHRPRCSANAPYEDVRLIVVTDNERILGLGDQGAGGMGIPVGKLALYVAAAGIHPAQTLPISLDVGTDNEALLGDDLYIGWRQPRLRGEYYDAGRRVRAGGEAALPRRPSCSGRTSSSGTPSGCSTATARSCPRFNDDIQGTAAIAVAGMLAGGRAPRACRSRRSASSWSAPAPPASGSRASSGRALRREGVRGETSCARSPSWTWTAWWSTRTIEYRRGLSWPAALAESYGLAREASRDLLAVVRAAEAHGAHRRLRRARPLHRRRWCARWRATSSGPLIFPSRTPRARSEATPADLLALDRRPGPRGHGQPVRPVEFEGRTVRIGQGNNVFVFPGVGLGVLVAEAREVTDGMFAAAAEALAEEAV